MSSSGGGLSNYLKAEALIRANFGCHSAKDLSVREFNSLYEQALWLETWRLQNQAELWMKLLGR